jgi:hypothetical protein
MTGSFAASSLRHALRVIIARNKNRRIMTGIYEISRSAIAIKVATPVIASRTQI